ncbi:unannotated protein [freshwater metagenome]|uniref:Unannotated protein n=1 Tax=freshwater metagenome TaxID=449393 RepID=A0A6J6R028_9ZZZZ
MVVIRPCSIPKLSSSTFTIGTKQLVVHEALEITLCCFGSKSLWFTPYTNEASAPSQGADTITSGAPAARCIAAWSRLVKMPVDSITRSTPRSPHGSSFGSRTDSTRSSLPSTEMPFLVAFTV